MKHHYLLITILILSLTLVGCGSQPPEPPADVIIEETETPIPPSVAPETVPIITEEPTVTTEANNDNGDTTVPGTEPGATESTNITHNETEAATEDIPECKHEYRYKTLKAPTCQSSGVRRFTCQKCGDSYLENLEPLDHSFIITKTEADCTHSGCTTYKCKDCGYTTTEDVQPPLGHTYGPLVTIKNPTDLLPGLARHTCIRCGEAEDVVLPHLVPNP